MSGKKSEGEKVCCLHFFCSHKFNKIVKKLLNSYRKKFAPIDKELKYLLPKKFALSSQKYDLGIWDPRPGIRKNLSRIQGVKGTESRILDSDPQHCEYQSDKVMQY
jgi:hypothetical protein